ncbi:hypothetical protein Syun_001457 [Stephania yunnanensis]|uniref:Uncharacterized protein n=1 Tax=Stephania yunnanensis TaxID=152371 RepID=A0AAP0LDR7_9MAGN
MAAVSGGSKGGGYTGFEVVSGRVWRSWARLLGMEVGMMRMVFGRPAVKAAVNDKGGWGTKVCAGGGGGRWWGRDGGQRGHLTQYFEVHRYGIFGLPIWPSEGPRKSRSKSIPQQARDGQLSLREQVEQSASIRQVRDYDPDVKDVASPFLKSLALPNITRTRAPAIQNEILEGTS